jgi:hypothetical protein
VETTEITPETAALVPSDGGLLIDTDRMQLGLYFEWDFIGLNVLGRPSLEVCGDMVKVLQIAEKSLQFAIGDFMNYCEGTHGEASAQLIPETGWTESTQRNYQWVASKVPKHLRRKELSFYHHQMIARLNTPEEQKLWLDRAVEGKDGVAWTARELKKAMSEAGRDVVFNPKAPKFLVVVECEGHDDVVACCRQLDNLGRKYTAKEPATT